jgi:hypothetical protein
MTDITNTIETLRAVVVATWSFLSPTAGNAPDAPDIADAIATAVAGDADPLYGSANVEAAVMAQWAWHESRLSTHPKAFSWDAHAGVSCGAFQERCATLPPTLLGQAVAWLALAHDGARTCPASPLAPLSGGCGGMARRLADRRVAEVLRIVRAIEAGPE